MDQSTFLNTFANLANAYNFRWDGTQLVGTVGTVGTVGEHKFNPVTALCYQYKGKLYRNNKRETLRAARAIGISQELALAVYSKSNRGHSQVVRGKMLQIVGR